MKYAEILELVQEKKPHLQQLHQKGLNKFTIPGYSKGSIRTCEAQILYSIIQDRGYSRILDIGTGPGFSAVYFAKALQSNNIMGHVDTIDISAPPLETFKLFGVDDIVNIHTGDSADIVPTLGLYDLILIDSSHTYEQTLKEYNTCIERLNPGGCMVFHDVFPVPVNYPDKGPRGVLEDIVEKTYPVTYFTEEMFDLFSYQDDLLEIKRMKEKWEIHNYSYRDRSANPKEAMALMSKS
mgnify:FL=1